MQKFTIFTLINLFFCLLLMSGCGSVNAGRNDSTHLVSALQQAELKENFSWTITDPTVRNYLEEVDLANLPPERELEVIILREIANASSKKELNQAFDRLWQEKKISRLLTEQQGQWQNFNEFGEIFYLLTIDPDSAWKIENAARIFRKTLSRLRPEQFNGYGLHFYTLGLLQSGRIEEALPYIDRLQIYTSTEIHMENLTTALKFAGQVEATNAMCRLMAEICQNCGAEEQIFPDREMTRALAVLKEKGILDETRHLVLPVIPDSLKDTVFVRELAESQPEPEFITSSPVKQAAVQPKTPFSLSLTRKSDIVLARIQIIRAGNQHHSIDPDLQDIAADLLCILKFSSLQLEKDESFFLAVKEKGGLQLPGGYYLQIVPEEITAQSSSLEVIISKQGKETLHTTIKANNGGITILGGPKSGKESLLLRISVFLGEMNKV